MKNLTLLLTAAFLLTTLQISFSQSCLPNGITFTTQDQIDSFPINYPGCTEIGGDVNVFGNSIDNLDGLQGITKIVGSLILASTEALDDISGLSNLTVIGSSFSAYDNQVLLSFSGLSSLTTVNGPISIDYNPGLQSLDGLQGLTNIGSLSITSNTNLQSLNGLQGLTSVASYFQLYYSAIVNLEGLNSLVSVGGSFEIIGNTNLVNFEGLDNIQSIGFLIVSGNSSLVDFEGINNVSFLRSMLISNNDNLISVDGFEGLSTIELGISVFTNPELKNLDGFSNVEQIGWNLNILGNYSLESVEGLQSLVTLSGKLEITDADSLVSLTGLQNLTHINGSLILKNNDILSDIIAIQFIDPVSIESLSQQADLIISNNPKLSNCAVLSICDVLQIPGKTITIEDNLTGCNNEAEINCGQWGVGGLVYYDFNQNGIKDSFEVGVSNQSVSIDPGFNHLTNSFGRYFQLCDTNITYNLEWIPNTDWSLTTDPASYTALFDPGNPNNLLNNFGIYPNFSLNDATINLSSDPTRCNTEVDFFLRYQNTGTFVESGKIVLSYEPTSSFVSMSPVVNYALDTVLHTLTWDFDSIYPYQEEDVTIRFAMPNENSTGLPITFIAKMYLDSFGVDIFFKDYVYEPLVLCSYDPNDKLVMPPGVRDEHYTLHDQKLTYTVRFQNTGNAEAIDIRILDTIDTDLDMTTFRIVNSSFPVNTSIKDNAIEFFFHNIWLPDSTSNESESHGFVTYEIKPIVGLDDYTEIKNTAHIIFDFNPPIVTNTTKNTMVTMIPVGIYDVFSEEIDIRPNPTSGLVNIHLPENKTTTNILIYNHLGQLTLQSKNTTFDVSHFPKGIYMVKAMMQEGQAIGKLVVE